MDLSEKTENTVFRHPWELSRTDMVLREPQGRVADPLALASLLGILSLGAAFALIVFIVIRKILFGDPVAGWPSLVCIILFFSGTQLFTTGILGQYIAKMYTEVKHRPIYIVQEEK